MCETWRTCKDVLAVYLSYKSFGNPLGLYLVNLISFITKRGV